MVERSAWMTYHTHTHTHTHAHTHTHHTHTHTHSLVPRSQLLATKKIIKIAAFERWGFKNEMCGRHITHTHTNTHTHTQTNPHIQAHTHTNTHIHSYPNFNSAQPKINRKSLQGGVES